MGGLWGGVDDSGCTSTVDSYEERTKALTFKLYNTIQIYPQATNKMRIGCYFSKVKEWEREVTSRISK
jgi:hypothetical protein